jgi:hypothetical protein
MEDNTSGYNLRDIVSSALMAASVSVSRGVPTEAAIPYAGFQQQNSEQKARALRLKKSEFIKRLSLWVLK